MVSTVGWFVLDKGSVAYSRLWLEHLCPDLSLELLVEKIHTEPLCYKFGKSVFVTFEMEK